MSSTRQPKDVEEFVPEIVGLFSDFAANADLTVPGSIALRHIASRWHDPHCECSLKKVCLRCRNVRRMILERLT